MVSTNRSRVKYTIIGEMYDKWIVNKKIIDAPGKKDILNEMKNHCEFKKSIQFGDSGCAGGFYDVELR